MARWVSPVPRSTVWWVSSSRSTTSAGSSSWRRWSALASLSSSACVLATTAVASTGRRLLDRVDVHRLALGRERVAGGGAGQLGHAADVAGGQRVDRLVLLAPHDEQAVQPLVGAGAAVHEVVVVADRAGQHLEQRHLADERVGDRLEHHRQRLAVGVGRHLHLGVAGAHGDGTVGRRRTDLHEEVGQPVDADLGGGRAAHDREHAGRLDAERERVLELLEAGHVALEVALEQRVVGHDDALDEVVVHLVLERLHVVGDRLGVGDAALVEVRGVGEEVGDAPEARPRRRSAARAAPRRRRAGRAAGRACARSWPARGRAC